MKLKIKKIDAAGVAATDVPALFKSLGMEYNKITNVNWPSAYPYLPDACFAMAHDGKNLYIHYKVQEDSVKGDFTKDYDNVWEDSCCEFFVAPAEDGLYYNIEMNCLGAMYLCIGKGRDGRERVPRTALESIGRWTSLGSAAIGLRSGMKAWESALVVPAAAFAAHKVSLGGAHMKGNIYKCGITEHNHYVSFAPIGTASPDFHRPEYFCDIEFE